MLRAFVLATGQLGDPAIVRVMLRSLFITLLIFVGLGVALRFLLDGADPCGLAGLDACPLGGGGSGFGAVLLTALAAWFLFPAVAIGVVSAFMDRIVAAVEARHYPDALASARPLGVAGSAWLGLRSSLRVLVYNLIASPLYLILLVTGIGPLILLVIVNGVAFGRDLGDMVAYRHLSRAPRRDWLRRTRSPRAVLGMVVTVMFLIPFLNLIAPVLAAAMATHVFHETRGRLAAR